jgi:hypothetical protein
MRQRRRAKALLKLGVVVMPSLRAFVVSGFHSLTVFLWNYGMRPPTRFFERQATLNREKHGDGFGGEEVIAGLEVGCAVGQGREQGQPRLAEFLDISPV